MTVKTEWDGRAIYLQIMEKIKRMIVRGNLKAGEKVLPVREMALDMGVNPNTVAKAYSELEREEILVPRRGMGTFVTQDGARLEEEKKKLTLQCAERLREDIQELGISVKEITEFLRQAPLRESAPSQKERRET